MAVRVKRILVPYGTVTALAERFGVSEGTVRTALRYGGDTPRQREIREAAVNDYGGKVTETAIPE